MFCYNCKKSEPYDLIYNPCICLKRYICLNCSEIKGKCKKCQQTYRFFPKFLFWEGTIFWTILYVIIFGIIFIFWPFLMITYLLTFIFDFRQIDPKNEIKFTVLVIPVILFSLYIIYSNDLYWMILSFNVGIGLLFLILNLYLKY